MYKPDTVILYNFSPRVDEAAIRLALGESRIAKTVWSSGATIGKFVIVKLTSVAVARRLLAGGANATLPAPAEDQPIRVCISGVPMCVAPSPISIDDVALPVRASKKAAAAGDASAAASPVRKSAGGQPRASSTPFTCNECGKEGHKARECPSKPPKAPVSCFRCGQEGHISKQCTQPADEQSSPAKRGAPAANGKKVQSQRDGGAASPAASPRGAPKAKGSDECKKCGSTEHLTRQCPGGNAAASTVSAITTAAKSAEPTATAAPAAPSRAPPKVVPALGQASAKQATKFADSDDDEDAPLRTVAKPKPQPAPPAEAASRPAQPSKGSAPSPAISVRPSQQDPKAAPTIVAKEAQKSAAAPVVVAAPPKPPTIARAPGADSCKFCGSDEHLSRRCPKKSG